MTLLARRLSRSRVAVRSKIVLGRPKASPIRDRADWDHGGHRRKWRERFRLQGMEGYRTNLAPGAPRKITDGQVEEAVQNLESVPTADPLEHPVVIPAGRTEPERHRAIWHSFGLHHRSETSTLTQSCRGFNKGR